jgi:hypothetical protein
MTISSFRRPLIALASLAMTTFLITGTATNAFAQTGNYSFTSAGAASLSKVVVRDALWRCNGGTCSTPAITTRPEVACAAAARKVGALSAFNAAGVSFNETQLAKCNAKAKK